MADSRSFLWMMILACFLFFLSGYLAQFRGAIIMWEPRSPKNWARITYRISWRRSYNHYTYCDNNTIANEWYIGPRYEYMRCLAGCIVHEGRIQSMNFRCTDFSVDEDWVAGENVFTFAFSENSDNYYQIGFSGSAWIELASGGRSWKSWELRTTVNLTVRSDTGTINSSPTSNIPLVVRVQHGCNATIEIPVNDVDGDDVRCRWAEYLKGECEHVCDAFQGAILNQNTCKISYSAIGQIGNYAVAVQIEDFAQATDTEPLSSVALQFVVLVFESDKTCTNQPVFVPPTRIDSSCIGVPFNTTFFEPLIAKSDTDSVSITEINSVSPIEVTKSDLAQYPDSETEWYVNISWTPTLDQEGSNIFCFSAVDSAGLNSEQSCITLLGGVTPPEIINGSQSPVGDILPTHSVWSIEFDMQFVQPTRPTYMYFYKMDDSLAHKVDVANVTGYPTGSLSRTLTIDPKFYFTEKEYYYVLLDSGIARGTSYCGAESSGIRDKTFWTVRIRDITPPKLSFLRNPPITNANVTISWEFDEDVITKCTLQTPSSVSVSACNDTWSGTDLPEGYYTLFIQGTDLENNAAEPVRKTWRVDRSAPILAFTAKPNPISNKTSFEFQFRCDEVCTTQCRLYQQGSQSGFSRCGGGFSSYYKHFNTGILTTDVQYVFEVKATDVVENEGPIITYTWQTDFVEPVIPALNAETVACGDDYSPNVTGMPSVTDNLDTDPVVLFGDEASGECGIFRVWNATDDAGNTAYSRQEIMFTSPRPPITQFPADANVPCGDLIQETTDLMLPAVKVTHPCGLPVNISYFDPSEAGRCGVTFTRQWVVTDDCGGHVSHSQKIRILELQVPDTPQNGQTNIDLLYTLRWPVYPGSVSYRIFLWNANDKKPSNSVAVTNEPLYAPPSPLRPGTQFLWQVEYILTTNETLSSPQWGFETRKFPDLTVETITVPPIAYSGQSFEVRWTVRNVGNLTTQAYRWYDGVYISFANNFGLARRASTQQQRNILFPDDGYTGQATVLLRDNDIGQLYVFVKTDIHQYTSDIDTSNNMLEASDIVEAKLTPPPDLRVDVVTIPASSYSGSEILVSFTVKNHGSGVTKVNGWRDQILWSTDPFFNTTDEQLKVTHRSGGLTQDESYSTKTTVVVPREIYGDFYIIVRTDVYNGVFEHTADNNNIGVSDVINVILSPPPDLRVVSFEVGKNFTTGDTMHVTWLVDNDGDTPYKQTWFDRIILQSLDGFVSEVLHTSTFSGKLTYNDTYTKSFTYIVRPHLPQGQYNLTLYVDYREDIFEFNKKDNNVRTNLITIYQALPDLAVKALSATVSTTDSGNDLQVNWTVVNRGPGRTIEKTWRDVIYITSDGGSPFQELVYSWNIEIHRTLNTNDTYEFQNTVQLPVYVNGNIRTKIIIDKYGRTADIIRSNNEHSISRVYVPVRTYDLELQQIERLGTGEIYSGSTILIKWKVVNSGLTMSDDSVWEEQLVLSPSSSSLTPKLAIVEVKHAGSLNGSRTYESNSTFKIPDTVVGDMFLHVVIDPYNKIFEGSSKANNAKYIRVAVHTPPSPDFTVTDVSGTISSTISVTHKVLTVSWTVKNIGNSMKVGRTWKDSVYLGETGNISPTSGNNNNYFLESFDVATSLQTLQTYKLTKTILMPHHVIGNYYVYVIIDSGDDILELNGEDNNIAHNNNIVVFTPPPTSKLTLELDAVGSEDSASIVSGRKTWIQFTVTNIGDITTTETSWDNVIYIINIADADKKTVLQNGFKVATIGHLGVLEPFEKYTVNASLSVPYDFLGDAYFCVLTLSGSSESNHDAFVQSTRFIVTKGKLPNLLPIMDTSVSEQDGGEPYILEYNVTNNGEELASGSRYDAVYLSDDIILDPFDRKLTTKIVTTSLNVNTVTTSSLSVFLPFDLQSKNYFLILVLDIRNDIYESDEQDNSAQKAVNIKERVSSDISVEGVNAPGDVSFGNQMQVSWKLRNNGQRQAKGYKCDTAYISDDNKWDITDEQLGSTTCGYITINPYTSTSDDKSSSVTASVPLLADDSYTAIVKTRSNILDNFLDNNVGIASSPTSISVAKLELESSVSITFKPNDERAYRIPNVPAEETLIVRVSGSNQENFNDLRIRFNKPATRFEFDKSSSDPFYSNQFVVLPNTKYGDYYVLVGYSGSTSANPKSSQITLEAGLAKFEILTTKPTKAATRGYLTLKFEGTLIPDDVTSKLKNTNRDIHAVEMFRFSSTLVWAKFDMTTASIGETYSASLSSEYRNLTTSLSDVLEIIDGTPGRAKATLSLPAALRPGERGFVYIDVQNEGDNDMIAPVIAVTTNSIGHLKYITNLKSTTYQNRHVMLASSIEGPGGILPPKAFSRLIFDAKQVNSNILGRFQIYVTIIEPSETKEHDYVKLKDTLRFSHYDTVVWEKVWTNFISYVGTSWFSLATKVSKISNQLSLAGRRIHELSDFVAFLLDMSDGPKGDNFVMKTTDLFLESSDYPHVSLEMERQMSPKVGLRSLNGFLGKGWTVPLWDTKLIDISPEIARLRFNQIDFNFMPDGFGAYTNNAIGRMVVRNSGCYYIDKKSEKEYQYNLTTGELLSVSSDRDGSFIRLMYDSNQRLEKLVHSGGAFINVAYDASGRIVSANLKNSTLTGEQLAVYSYDPLNNLLVSATINGRTTTYEFYPSGFIKVAIYPEGRREEFEFSREGHLTSRTPMRNGEFLAQMQYKYDGNAEVTRIVNPGDIEVTSTFNELGHIAAAHRKGSFKETFISTLDTRSIYEGDSVVTFERYDKTKNSVYLEDGNGDSIEFEYDRLGQMKILRDGGGNAYSLERNRNGTLKKFVFPDKSEENYNYRPDGHDVVTCNGVTKQFDYDSNGRVVWKNIGNGDIATYQFNNDGNMASATNAIGDISFSYGENSQLQSISYPNNRTLHYEFSKKGMLSGMNSSLGYNVEYTYNNLDKLTEITDKETGNMLMQAEYNDSGKLKKKRLGNGAFTTYFYQIYSGLLKAQFNYFPNGTLSSKFEYGYNVRERRISLKTLDGEWKFRYDTSGQVTYIKRPDGHQTFYSYDGRKNRKTVTKDGVSKLYKANNMNQYTDFDDNQKFMYDKNGNLIEVTGTKSRQYRYDEENKMIGFNTPDANCIFIYDAIDSLHKKQCQDGTTQYLVDPFGKNGPDILAETDSSGDNTYYYHGGNQLGLVAMKKGIEVYYYQFDPLGSVVSLLGKDGSLLNSYKSEPFGEIYDSFETIKNPFRFVGQWGVMNLAEVPELFYMRARFYDTQHGRFLSMDPLGIAGRSKNFYTYAYNNPIHFNDPKGTIPVWVATGAINTLVYAGFQLATGEKIELGGVAAAFVTGALGGAAGQRVISMTKGIWSNTGRYLARANLMAQANVAINAIGSVVSHVGNNIFGDQPFNPEKLGTSLVNGVAQTFAPGWLGRAGSSLLSNIGDFMLDPTKSLAEQWQGIKDTWKKRADWVKDKFEKAKNYVEDTWKKTKEIAERKWDDFTDYVGELKDKVGEKWEDLKENLKDKLDDIKETVKEKWEYIKDKVSDQWENIKEEAKEKWDDVKNKIVDTWEDLKDEVSDRWDDLKDDARETFDDFKNRIKDKWEETKDKISDKVDETMRDLADAYDKVKDKMEDFKDDLKYGFDDLVDDVKKVWKDFKDDMSDLADGVMAWVVSIDPNDIVGPSGYGAARFIAKSSRLDYKIRFENDPNATAPAQRVFIEHKFDSDLNPRTFRIGTFGFGNYTHELMMDRSFLQKTINLTEDFGIFLRVVGGLDIVNGRATWEFQSIDPDTGSPPADPRIGFLPPNNGTTGQGFVTFSIAVDIAAPSLARIDATATIYFDQNEPIETPPIFNTVDDSPPSVNASVVNDTLLIGSLALALNSYDVGAGLKDINILLKEDDGYTVLMSAVNESAVTLPLSPGGTYDLVFSPVDHVVTCTGVNNCSGNGNCTGIDICACEEGFYGADCSTSTPPIEPPILELMSAGGFEDDVIPLYVLAKLIDGTTPNDLKVTLDGFPLETSFSHGQFDNSKLTLQANDFGNINVTFPTDFAGNVSLSARADHNTGGTSVSRTGEFKIVVMPVIDWFILTADVGCNNEYVNSGHVDLDISVTLGDTDNSETARIIVELPPKFILDHGQIVSGGRYLLNQTDIMSTLTVTLPDNQQFDPVRVKVTAAVTDFVNPTISVAKSVETLLKSCQVITSPTLPTNTSLRPQSTPEKTTGIPTSSTEADLGPTDEQTRQTVIIAVCSVIGFFLLVAIIALIIKLRMDRRGGADITRLRHGELKDTAF